MLKMNKTRARIGMTAAVAFLATVIVMGCSGIYGSDVSAAGGAGGTDTSSGGGGGTCGDFSWTGGGQHTCIGAAWMEFTVGTPPSGSSGHKQYDEDKPIIDKIDSKCKDYGSYYRLGLPRFEAVADSSGKNVFGSFKDHQLGYFKQVQQVSPVGSIKYRADAPGALELATVKDKFDTAQRYWQEKKKNGATLNADTEAFIQQSWNETSWFCWNEDLYNGNVTSTFGTWSTAVAKDSKGNTKLTVNTKTLDSNNSGTVKTKEDVIYVDFKHRFNYEKPTSGSGTFDPAVTYYGVQVSGAANQTVVSPGTKYTVPSENSGPSRPIGPQEPNLVGESTQVINVPETGTATVCSKISYDPKVIGWKEKSGGGYAMDPATTQNMGKSSEVCVTVERIASDEEEPEDGGQINFWSSSKVSAVNQDDGSGSRLPADAYVEVNDKNESDIGKTATLILGIDKDNIDVEFSHSLYKFHSERDNPDKPMESEQGEKEDEWPDDICTTFTITRAGEDETPAENTYCHPVDPDEKEVYKEKYNVKVPKVDEVVKVCSKIDYTPRTITLNRTKNMRQEETGNYLYVSNYDGQEELYAYDRFWDEYFPVYRVYDPWGWDVVILYYIDGKPVYSWNGPVYYIDRDDNWYPIYEKEYIDVLVNYTYEKDGEDGEGGTEACVEVIRPSDPDMPGSGPEGPSQGTVDPDRTYVGETTTMSWDLKARYYDVRRIINYQPIVFQVHVRQNPDSNATKGDIAGYGVQGSHGNLAPCSYYSSRVSLRDGKCSTATGVPARSDTNGIGSPSSTTQYWSSAGEGSNKANYEVPEYVGDKYCNSAGLQWGRWFGKKESSGNGGTSTSYFSYGSPYWTIYDAACKTIVKKPTTAFWNGGLFTNGGVITSLAPRHVSGDFNTIAGSGVSTFGSWAEYLGVIHGSNSRFASGSTLAFSGTGTSNFNLWDNSRLTIANNNASANVSGYSGISSTSTLRDRLNTYLIKDAIELPGGSTISAENLASGTKVYKVNGDVTIGGDIKVTPSDTSSIYTMPQVIIYATGNINIASSVSRIDAWLISEKTLNTCAEFNSGNIQAYVRDAQSPYTGCAKQLTINGPVIAKSVQLNRTAGADILNYSAGAPFYNGNDTVSSDGGDYRAVSGEIFNLSASSYLWGYAQAGRYDSSYTEAYTRELPPRY